MNRIKNNTVRELHEFAPISKNKIRVHSCNSWTNNNLANLSILLKSWFKTKAK